MIATAMASTTIIVLVVWHFTTGKIAVDQVTSRPDEIFYWVTILISNTLGTALGDFTADTAGLGFEKGALVFAGLIALVATAYFIFKGPASVFFWSAYILTRPLGATLGDTLTKPHQAGGLSLGRISSSLVRVVAMIAVIALTSLRHPAGKTAGADS
jgi:uncharacterized membrane-anchored protein